MVGIISISKILSSSFRDDLAEWIPIVNVSTYFVYREPYVSWSLGNVFYYWSSLQSTSTFSMVIYPLIGLEIAILSLAAIETWDEANFNLKSCFSGEFKMEDYDILNSSNSLQLDGTSIFYLWRSKSSSISKFSKSESTIPPKYSPLRSLPRRLITLSI